MNAGGGNLLTGRLSALYRGAERRSRTRGQELRTGVPSTGPLSCLCSTATGGLVDRCPAPQGSAGEFRAEEGENMRKLACALPMLGTVLILAGAASAQT